MILLIYSRTSEKLNKLIEHLFNLKSAWKLITL